MKMKRLRQLCGLMGLLTLMICTPLFGPTSAIYASNSNQDPPSEPLETITLDDGTRVIKDTIVVYPSIGGNNLRVLSLPTSLTVSLQCGGGDQIAVRTASCPPEYNVSIDSTSTPGDTAVLYNITALPAAPDTEISAAEYAQILSDVSAQLAPRNACTTDARLVVAGGSWHSGGGSWHSGGGSWHSGSDNGIIYQEAYEQQWSLDMVEKSTNIYGEGSGLQVTFIDVFDPDSAALAGLSIVTDTAILYAAVPTTDTVDLTLHGNVVHSVFDSIAPDVSTATGISVFNRAGEAINASVVRGVELAVDQLPANSVINMSFGIDTPAIDPCTKQALESLFEEAESKGITLVASSGNESEREQEQPVIKPMQYPADSGHVLGVAAVGPDRGYADYSNEGEIMAPGGNGDDGIIVRVPFIDDAAGYEDRYAEAQGTSFAAPYVSATIINLLSDGILPADIPTKLEQITDSNCGVVSLNPFYAEECLTGYQEINRHDYGVQRLPLPQYGPNPDTWNTEPHWIGDPPCLIDFDENQICYVDNNPVARPYIYAEGERVIRGVKYINAADAFAAYSSYRITDPFAKPELFGIQVLATQSSPNSGVMLRPMWLGVPDVCDEFSTGISFDATVCESISPVLFPEDTLKTSFYYYGSRPVEPEMMITDFAYQNCAGFDGKVFDNAGQADCVYRKTRDVMEPFAPTEDGSVRGNLQIEPVLSPRPREAFSSETLEIRTAEASLDDGILPTIFVPLIVK